LRFQRELHRLIVIERAPLLLIHHVQHMATREPAHLFEALHWDQRRQCFALAFDDEFIVSQRDTIQHVTNPLADVDRRHPISHASPATCLVAHVRRIAGADRMDDSSITKRLMKRQERRGRKPMATFRIRHGLKKSDANPQISRSLSARFGARWRPRRITISGCLSTRFPAITARTPPGATQLRSHNGEVQQGDQEVLHARVSAGRTPGTTQRCPIRESAGELAIRDPQLLNFYEHAA
jgi:hypothetical protein